MRLIKAALLCSAAVIWPGAATAEPITALYLGFTGAASTTAIAASVLYPGFFGIGAFFGQTLLGSLLLNAGINYLLRPRAQRPPDLESVRLNSRVAAPDRFQVAGTVAVGGAAGIFAEFDESGNFWYIVAHADNELTGDPSYFFDTVPLTISDGTDGFTAGDVLTDDFCLTTDGNAYEGTGTRVPQFRVYTVTPDSSNIIGTKPTAFTAAFPSLPADFHLAGVTYSIVRVKAVTLENRHKVYRWRGAMGLGEPSVTLLGNFSRIYDPREPTHDIDDSSTWTAGNGNPAIIWAWWRTNRFGRGRPMSEVNWNKVAEQADLCDTLVQNRSGVDVPMYRCGIAVSDKTERQEAESDILSTCDGFVAYDNVGAAYPVVGYYVAPTLSLDGDRDIVSARTEIIDDGESEVDGVVVRYTSPDHNYTTQPCAPWRNPTYYVEGREPNYAFVDILGCQDHNQAFRLAGAIGARIAPPRRGAFGCTVKGILAKSERAVNLDYDSDFSGVYEIASPVEESDDGMATAFAVVPLAADRWTGAGQSEGAPPAPEPSLNIDTDLETATNVVITAEQIATDGGAAVRIAATFDAPDRPDRSYRFRYAPNGTTEYEYFVTDMEENRAYSAIVPENVEYVVQWQTVTGGGRASGWAADVGGGETEYLITPVANPTAPDDLTAASATGGTGETVTTWTAANDPNQYAVRVYRGTTATFGSASLVATVLTAANASGGFTDTGLAADTYYYWFAPINGSGVEGNADGPHSVTVT